MSIASRQVTRKAIYIVLPCILLITFWLRVWQLDSQALSGDEAFSVINWTRTSLDRLLTEIAFIDPQPPVALLSFYGWVRLVGDTVFAARMLSVLAGMIGVAAAYSLTTQLLGRQVGIVVAITTAINPLLIWHSQDLRSYGLWIGLSILTLAALIRAFRKPSLRNWVLYTTVASLTIYTYYLELFILIAHNIYALSNIIKRRELLKTWIICQVVVGLILAPWFLQPALRESGYQPTAGSPDLTGALQTFLFGTTLPSELRSLAPFPQAPAFISILVLILITTSLLYAALRLPPKTALLTITASLFPIIALGLLAFVTGKGYFHPRYVAASTIPTLILVTAFLTPTQEHTPLRNLLTGSVLTVVWGLSIWSFINYRTDERVAKAPDWPEIVTTLNHSVASNDLILQNYPDPAFTYYYTGSVERQTLPERSNPPAEQTIRKLEAYANEHDYIWFMPVESDAYDRKRVVITWLQANMQLVSTQQIGATHILQFGSWSRNQPQVELSPSPEFENVKLIGYTLNSDKMDLQRGATISLELFWYPLSQSSSSQKIYVHLIGPNTPEGSPLWAQDDRYPQMGRIDSANWLVGQIFPDVYHFTIPVTASAGQYWVTVGLYDPQSNQRSPLLNASNIVDTDSATILSFALP